MLNIKWNLALLVMLAGLAAPQSKASMVTLFDNTSFVTGGDGLISQLNPIGDSFSTGAVAIDLIDFSAVLSLQGTAKGSTTFSLYSDNSETPDTLISTVGTIDDTSLTPSAEDYLFSGPDIALAANTRYWIVATATGNAAWWSADDTSGTGTANEFLAANQIFPDSDGPFNMSVTGETESGSDTPEPGTLALAGVGLAFAVAWRARSHGWARGL